MPIIPKLHGIDFFQIILMKVQINPVALFRLNVELWDTLYKNNNLDIILIANLKKK